jgi:nucleoside-diphosphate-sugar epimerase
VNHALPVCVLGGAGFVGSALVREARSRGIECLTPSREEITRLKKPLGHVVYAIGLTADFRTRPLDTVEAHICVLRSLLAEADFASLTYLSSTRVYAGNTDTSERADLRVNPHNPSDLYNLSKLAGESLCLHSGRQGIKIARLSNVIGPGQGSDNFVGQLLQEAMAHGHAVMQTAPGARKDYISLDDAAALLLDIARGNHIGVFNVASGEATTGQRIADLIHQVLGLTVQTNPKAPNWDFQPIDTTRVQRDFSFVPQPFAEHFAAFLAGFLEMKKHP